MKGLRMKLLASNKRVNQLCQQKSMKTLWQIDSFSLLVYKFQSSFYATDFTLRSPSPNQKQKSSRNSLRPYFTDLIFYIGSIYCLLFVQIVATPKRSAANKNNGKICASFFAVNIQFCFNLYNATQENFQEFLQKFAFFILIFAYVKLYLNM